MKPSDYALDEPIAAIATAIAPAALGIVRASGSGSVDLVAALFSRPEALADAAGGTFLHGWLVDPATGSRVDEVVVAVYRAPRSFTGEDSVEIIGHGGVNAVRSVHRLLLRHGFRDAGPGEFTFRAFARGKSDLTRAEAVREIVDARTGEARERAAARLSGALAAELAECKNAIIAALASIEAEVEYPEDEEAVGGAFDASLVSAARERLARLESTWASERVFREGARVVLAGRVNAGKSSLFNALLKEDRAIVSESPGTTRDWIEATVDLGGIPARLVDTAGLRDAHDPVEAIGVERARDLANSADLTLYVVDSVEGLVEEDRAALDALSDSRTPAIVVWNKADKPARTPIEDMAEATSRISVSAKTGAGIAELVAAARARLLPERGAPTPGGPALGSERQRDAVRDAVSCLDKAIAAAASGFPMDAVAEDLETALGRLGEVTGETTPTDVLDALFSGFCVGK